MRVCWSSGNFRVTASLIGEDNKSKKYARKQEQMKQSGREEEEGGAIVVE